MARKVDSRQKTKEKSKKKKVKSKMKKGKRIALFKVKKNKLIVKKY